MPGTIQSIERAAAMLRLLGSAGRPLALAEMAAPLDLPRPTAHGILRTLREVGFVDQDRDTGRYTLAAGLRRLGGGWDRHDLRSRAMNWADSLAGERGAGGAARHAGRCRRSSWCTTSSGPTARRSGCGRASSFRCTPRPSASACSPSPRSRCPGRTSSICSATPDAPSSPSARSPSSSRRSGTRGWAGELGEHRTGVGGLAAPVRTGGGLVVGALGVEGPVEELFSGGGTPRAAPGRAAAERGAGDLGRAGGDPVTERVVAAIDQGTTSTRCLLFNPAGRMVAVAQREHRQHYPRSGWVEHDAEEIWRNVTRIVPAALRSAGLGPENIVALGIANQRETTVIWDRHTGYAAGPGDHLAGHPHGRDRRPPRRRRAAPTLVTELCGLPPATYFAGPRLRWLLDHVPGARAGAEAGDVLFGTMESWLVWKLTGGPDGGAHITDVTNASRTMLMDLQTRTWDPELLDALDIPARMLPEIRPNSEVYGTCTRCCPGCRSPGRWATSRPRSSGRRASPRARPSARTARARSC